MSTQANRFNHDALDNCSTFDYNDTNSMEVKTECMYCRKVFWFRGRDTNVMRLNTVFTAYNNDFISHLIDCRERGL